MWTTYKELIDTSGYRPAFFPCNLYTARDILVYRVLLGKPEGRRPLGRLGVDGWIIIGWISRRWDVGIWTGLGWARIETGGGRL